MSDKKIAANTIYQFLTKIITSACGFFITILLAHYYGAGGYGEFTKITAFVALFYIISDFGINAIFLQYEEIDAKFNQLLSLRLYISLGLVMLVNLIVLFLSLSQTDNSGFSPGSRFNVFIFSLTIITNSILLTATAIFQKKLKYDRYLSAVSIGTILTLLLIILFSILKMPLQYVFISYLLGNTISSLISIVIIHEKILPLTLNKKFALNIIKKSYPLGLMLFFNLIYFRVDIVILSLLKNTTEVAIYGYAFKYLEFLLAIPLFLSNAIYPFLIGSLKNLRKYYQLTRKYLLIYFTLSIILSVFAFILAPIIAIVKNDFIPSIFIFRILLLSLPVFFLTSILQWILISQNQKLYLLKTYLISAIINLLLNIIFIPQYGSLAAATITGVSEVLVLVLLSLKYSSLKKKQISHLHLSFLRKQESGSSKYFFHSNSKVQQRLK